MIITGRVWKVGDDVNTDEIIPARYLNTFDSDTLAAHCMEDLDPSLTSSIGPGDILVAGKNFGCGSSREHAPLALKSKGVAAVIADSFARIFYRNAINIGLAILECPEAATGIKTGDQVQINLETGEIKNLTAGVAFLSTPFPDFLQRFIDLGGLVNYIRQQITDKQQKG